MKFYVDLQFKFADFSRAFNYSWNTSSETEGSHSIKARAYDFAGNWAEKTNNVTVDRTFPTIRITNPLDGQTVSGTLIVSADANDNFGIAAVGFYIDGSAKVVDSIPPYQYSWNTLGYSNGIHSVAARAADRALNQTPQVIYVTVNN